MKNNYETLNNILGQIEPLLISLAREKKLARIDITRWRWDEPDLTLSWWDKDLEKNIHVLIDEKDNIVKIECNTWKDYDTEKGRRRKWLSFTDEININISNADIDAIREGIKKVYDVAAGWKAEKLKDANEAELTKEAKKD